MDSEKNDKKSYNISCSKLSIVPEIINKFQSLEKLDLSFNKITKIPEYKNLTKLKWLNLSYNKLKKFPDGIFNLEYLDISYNPEILIPKSIDQLSKLKYLNLSGNKLIELPDEIGNLKYLYELNISFNFISKLPNSISQLIKLEKIWVHKNNLYSLPDSFSNLISLKILDLFDNNFTLFPKSIFELTSLEELYLGNNQLNYISCPDELMVPLQIKKLTTLSLENNKLEDCQNLQFVGLLKMLKYLNIENNPITCLPITLFNLYKKNRIRIDL